jgi:ribosomal protein L14
VTLQRELTQFDDELRKYYERMDGKLFDRDDRLAILENQKCNPAPNSIFGAIFQELKSKARHEKHKRIM